MRAFAAGEPGSTATTKLPRITSPKSPEGNHDELMPADIVKTTHANSKPTMITRAADRLGRGDGVDAGSLLKKPSSSDRRRRTAIAAVSWSDSPALMRETTIRLQADRWPSPRRESFELGGPQSPYHADR